MTPLQLLNAVEAAGVTVARGGSYVDGRPWVEISSTTWLEIGKTGKFELYWNSRDGGPVNELDNLIELPRLLPRRLRTTGFKDLKRKPKAVAATRPEKSVKPKQDKTIRQMSGLIKAAVDAMTAIQADTNCLLDKKGIAQIVKAAVQLRDLGKKARS